MPKSAMPDLRNGFIEGRTGSDKIMLITTDRLVYVGLIGKPQAREFGSLTVYVSLDTPFQIQVGNQEWESAEMYVVAPDTPHRITTNDRLIGVVMIEAEAVDPGRLPEWLRPTRQAGQCLLAMAAVRRSFSALRSGEVDLAFVRDNVDQFFFGQPLARRLLDVRMAAVVDKINYDPCGLLGAEECARCIDLSFSRFLHLFKEDVGTTFRGFRAWKRARSFLNYVNIGASLTDIALDIGYPDSSHFSHTIRRYWGLTPKDMVAGSRQLAIINQSKALTSATF